MNGDYFRLWFFKEGKNFFFYYILKGDYWGDDNFFNWIIDFVELWSVLVVKKFIFFFKVK